eukprot:19540-Heterococcus_DN1.PRE.1
MPTHSNTTPERLEGWESLDRGSTATPEPVFKQSYQSAQLVPGAASAHDGTAANSSISISSSVDDCTSFVCNECGLVTTTVPELQLHMVRKTAWSNAGLIGCRVSCLIDSREWQEAIVVAFQRCSSSSSSSSSSSAAC